MGGAGGCFWGEWPDWGSMVVSVKQEPRRPGATEREIIPLTILEASFTTWVVNPAHIEAVPGRKTDVRDSVWIVELLHGLLKPLTYRDNLGCIASP